MTKGITEKEPDPRIVYADIIDLPHYQSPNHPRMSLYDRAAQFAPFAALSGYEDMIDEETRYVDQKEEAGEKTLKILNRKLGGIVYCIMIPNRSPLDRITPGALNKIS